MTLQLSAHTQIEQKTARQIKLFKFNEQSIISTFQVQFDPTQSEQIIRVIVKGDELEEANEEVVLTLTGKFIPKNPIKTH